MNIIYRLHASIIGAILASSAFAQNCINTYPETAPVGRYIINNETVIDKVTGLMWEKCSQGLSGDSCDIGNADKIDWKAALSIPATVSINGGLSGYSDWRLPNIKELLTLVEDQCNWPSINSTIFPGTLFNTGTYWTSSPVASGTDAWGVDFAYGETHMANRGSALYVRLVRDCDESCVNTVITSH